jgi:transposase-like protein
MRRRLCPAQPGPAESPQRASTPGFDTRAGTIDVAIAKLRQGSYFSEWLLPRRKRAERALTSVVANLLSAGSFNASDGTAG